MADFENEVRETENVPPWIEQGITWYSVQAIQQSGCASGAYMPAVTYYQAMKTMGEHGDDILDYIQETYGVLPTPSNEVSWSGLAVFYLSIAVEMWASGLEVPEEE